ncbi:MAG: leucine-rich repeat protein [Kiritimatiellia bacterium]
MKTPAAFISIVITALALAAPAGPYAHGPYTYIVEDNQATITYFDRAYSGDLSITNELGGHPVALIDVKAFADCTTLSSVTIPASVTNIDDYAFSNCTALTNILFLGNAPTPGRLVFSGTPATIHYRPGTTGWKSTFADRPTQPVE